jgi:uncharacterized protein YlxW (UPF0749 family)
MCNCGVIISEESGEMSLEFQRVFQALKKRHVRRRKKRKARQENGTAREEERDRKKLRKTLQEKEKRERP